MYNLVSIWHKVAWTIIFAKEYIFEFIYFCCNIEYNGSMVGKCEILGTRMDSIWISYLQVINMDLTKK